MKKEHTCSAWKQDQDKDCNTKCPACREQDEIECTCPDWWFPSHRRETLRKLPHGFGRTLNHHSTCAKANIPIK